MKALLENLLPVVRDGVRLLTFRLTPEQFERFGTGHLVFGLCFTWLVGIGRWWDDPGANILQHIGLGSVIYVFVLATVLVIVAAPLNPKNWSYRQALTLVSMTSPPALLYAIPVERFTDVSTAASLNVWFLAIVATWRFALLIYFYVRIARLSVLGGIIAALLPIMGIIVLLTILNLERAVFDIMGGLRKPGTASDDAYAVMVGLSVWSVILLLPIGGIYLYLIVFQSSRERKKNRDKIIDVGE